MPLHGVHYLLLSGRTTLIVAHRLSTIRNADRIIVMQKGEVVEEGAHDSLMEARGIYFHMVEQQSLRQAEEEEEFDFEQRQAREIQLSEALTVDESDWRCKRSSTVISISPSVLAMLYGKKDSITGKNMEEKVDVNVKGKKVKTQRRKLNILTERGYARRQSKM